MEKATRIVLILLVFIGTLSACKKCEVCTVLDEDSNAIYEYLEVCGTKNDLKAYKSRCETEYGAYDYTCSCQEKQ